MTTIISIFSDWSFQSILYGFGVLILVQMVLEITFSRVIKRRSNKYADESEMIRDSGHLKILRNFLRFLLIYIFIRIIKLPEGPMFPWNIIYELSSLVILISGIIISVHKLLNLSLEYYDHKPEENLLPRDLLLITNKGLKTTLYFLSASLLLWKALEQIPENYKNNEIIKIGLLANGIIISIIVMVLIRKTSKTVLNIPQDKKENSRLYIIIKSLSLPLQIVTLAVLFLWFKNVNLVPSSYDSVLDKFINLFLLYSLILFIYQVVETLGIRLSSYSNNENNTLDKTFIELIRMIVRISIIVVGIFSTVQILTGKPLTALMAGLGIGGLAVALAAQDTIKNFFGSIMIMTDKPFKIGERVVVKDYDGVIEAIGFRSTRIRTLVGHQVVIPNDQMASNPIENIGKRPYIRRLTNITVTYGTSPEKMIKALDIIKSILDNHEGMNEDFPPRVYFNEFNADSLNIIMLYWYSPPDYWKFMEFTQKVNLQIMKDFAMEGIEFAFPTSTTYLEQADGQSIKLEIDKMYDEILKQD